MSLTSVNTLAFDTWEPGINSQLENEDGSLYAFLNKSSKDVRGRRVYIKLRVGRSTGIANIAEGGDFPTAGDPTYNEAQLALSRVAATVEWTQDEMDLLNGPDAAAVPVMEEKMTDMTQTLRRDVIRQTWGDGLARLARANTTGSGVVISLQATTTNQYDRDRWIWLEPNGMKIDAVNSTTGAVSWSGRNIVSTDETNNTITIDGANVTAATTDIIVRSGNTTASAGAFVSREFPGVMAAIATGNTYLTLNRATAANAVWKSNVITGDVATTLQALTIDRIMKLINTVTRKTGTMASGADYCFFSNLGVWSAYGELLQPAQRYQAGQKLDFGWPSLECFGMMLYGDIHAPHNNLFLIHKPSFAYRRPAYENRGLFQWQDMDGSIFRYKPGAAAGNYASAVQSQMTGMLTLVTERPNRHGRLDDIIEAGVV